MGKIIDPKTLIISYPRSGNTLFRYILERASGMPTDGTCDNPVIKNHLMQPLIHKGKYNYIAYKSHRWNAIQADTVIFILRDYKECLIRHHEKPRGISFDLFKSQTRGGPHDYINLIQKFDKFEGTKHLIYYEDHSFRKLIA